jgi:hypothetical protein
MGLPMPNGVGPSHPIGLMGSDAVREMGLDWLV